MELNELVIIKIGTNSLLDTDEGVHRLNVANIEKVSDEVNKLRQLGYAVVVVSSGGITTGMMVDGHTRTGEETTVQEQRYATIGWPQLAARWSDNLEGTMASMLLDRESMDNSESWGSAKLLLAECWKAGDAVVVNNNDTISIQEIAYTDNDELAGGLAAKVANENIFSRISLVMLTDVAGVMRDFGRDNQGLVRVVEADHSVVGLCGGSKSANSRGGMHSKVAVIEEARRYGIEGYIANVKDDLFEVAAGRLGTKFLVE